MIIVVIFLYVTYSITSTFRMLLLKIPEHYWVLTHPHIFTHYGFYSLGSSLSIRSSSRLSAICLLMNFCVYLSAISTLFCYLFTPWEYFPCDFFLYTFPSIYKFCLFMKWLAISSLFKIVKKSNYFSFILKFLISWNGKTRVKYDRWAI